MFTLQLTKDYEFWLKIIGIILGSYIINRIAIRAFDKAFTKAPTRKTRTVLQVLQNSISVTITIIAGLTLLTTFNINIIPLLASASVLGFAVGFGSQSLIKDMISGIFILTSDTIYEGDIIRVNGTEGKVEKVGIRTVTVRDLDGVLHTVPNGTIGTISNLTKDWSRANIDIGIPSEYEIDKIIKIFEEELQFIQNDPLLKGWILGEPTVEGINKIEGNKIIIKTLLKTNQAKKWDMEREFNYRIKKRFEKENLKFA